MCVAMCVCVCSGGGIITNVWYIFATSGFTNRAEGATMLNLVVELTGAVVKPRNSGRRVLG